MFYLLVLFIVYFICNNLSVGLVIASYFMKISSFFCAPSSFNDAQTPSLEYGSLVDSLKYRLLTYCVNEAFSAYMIGYGFGLSGTI